jgi:hypothetical protein
MRSYEFRQRQRAKRKKWATKIVSRWADPASPKGRREVGKVATTHTFCGCYYCRRPKLEDLPTRRERREAACDWDRVSKNG